MRISQWIRKMWCNNIIRQSIVKQSIIKYLLCPLECDLDLDLDPEYRREERLYGDLDLDLDLESLDLGDPFSLDGDLEWEYVASDLWEPSDSLECDLDIRSCMKRVILNKIAVSTKVLFHFVKSLLRCNKGRIRVYAYSQMQNETTEGIG